MSRSTILCVEECDCGWFGGSSLRWKIVPEVVGGYGKSSGSAIEGVNFRRGCVMRIHEKSVPKVARENRYRC